MASDRPKKKRKKRYLLTAVALSTGSMMSGCGSQQGSDDPAQGTGDTQGEVREVEPLPLPANPKGSVYDEGLNRPPPPREETEPTQAEPVEDGEPREEPTPPPPPEETPPQKVLPLPANPKGALYDDGPYRGPGDVER